MAEAMPRRCPGVGLRAQWNKVFVAPKLRYVDVDDGWLPASHRRTALSPNSPKERHQRAPDATSEEGSGKLSVLILTATVPIWVVVHGSDLVVNLVIGASTSTEGSAQACLRLRRVSHMLDEHLAGPAARQWAGLSLVLQRRGGAGCGREAYDRLSPCKALRAAAACALREGARLVQKVLDFDNLWCPEDTPSWPPLNVSVNRTSRRALTERGPA